MNIKILAFPDVVPSSLLYRHQRFGATYCFFFPSEHGNGMFLKYAVDQWSDRCHISGGGGDDDYL